MAYGWFGFHDGLEGLQWVPWSDIRNLVTASEEMLVTVTVCRRWRLVELSLPIIWKCHGGRKGHYWLRRSPRAERTLHASIRIIGYACVWEMKAQSLTRLLGRL